MSPELQIVLRNILTTPFEPPKTLNRENHGRAMIYDKEELRNSELLIIQMSQPH